MKLLPAVLVLVVLVSASCQNAKKSGTTLLSIGTNSTIIEKAFLKDSELHSRTSEFRGFTVIHLGDFLRSSNEPAEVLAIKIYNKQRIFVLKRNNLIAIALPDKLFSEYLSSSKIEGLDWNNSCTSDCGAATIAAAMGGALSGAGSGAQIGSITGPEGAIGGAVIGSMIGGIAGGIGGWETCRTATRCNSRIMPENEEMQ